MQLVKKFILAILAIFSAQVYALSYTDKGVGLPIIFIHAFPTDHRLWLPQQEELAKYFRVITLDLPGFGDSKATDGSAITMYQYAAAVNQLLNQLHIPKAIIAGESMGGYVALAFLKQYPEKTQGLILANTQSIADTPEVQVKREAAAKDILVNGPESFINNFMTKALSTEASADTREYLHSILITQPATGMASALRGMAQREDLSDELRRTNIPILIISAVGDNVISPQQSEYMHTLAKNSQLISLTNAGHLANLEQVRAWDQAVVNMFG